MPNFFSTTEAARYYDQYRPRVHGVVLEWLSEALGQTNFSRAVDVACGTGHSSLPLRSVSRDLVCIDSSRAMLDFAENAGLNVHLGTFNLLESLGKFDLLSTCMAFHWFDPEEAIRVYKTVSNPGAIWLIYNFGFLGHTENRDFNRWLKLEYLERYPSPPRNKFSGVVPRDDKDLACVSEGRGRIPIEFDRDALVGYFLTQSNIEAAVQGGRSYSEIESELSISLGNFELGGDFDYGFTFELYRYVGS